MWLYYDEYDKRHCNWIANPMPSDDYRGFKTNYQKSYFKKRMEYMNQEISRKAIFETIEKAVPLAVLGFAEFRNLHEKFINGEIRKSMFLKGIKQIEKELMKNSYSKIDIFHGNLDIQSYYEKGTFFVENVYFMIDEMRISIERGDSDSIINFFFKGYVKRYEKYYNEYLHAKELL